MSKAIWVVDIHDMRHGWCFIDKLFWTKSEASYFMTHISEDREDFVMNKHRFKLRKYIPKKGPVGCRDQTTSNLGPPRLLLLNLWGRTLIG